MVKLLFGNVLEIYREKNSSDNFKFYEQIYFVYNALAIFFGYGNNSIWRSSYNIKQMNRNYFGFCGGTINY